MHAAGSDRHVNLDHFVGELVVYLDGATVVGSIHINLRDFYPASLDVPEVWIDGVALIGHILNSEILESSETARELLFLDRIGQIITLRRKDVDSDPGRWLRRITHGLTKVNGVGRIQRGKVTARDGVVIKVVLILPEFGSKACNYSRVIHIPLTGGSDVGNNVGRGA